MSLVVNWQKKHNKSRNLSIVYISILIVLFGFVLENGLKVESRGRFGGYRRRNSPTMENFEKYKIKSDLIDEAPKEKLAIHYPTGVWVNLGNTLMPTQVKDEPSYSYDGRSDKLYTLLMIDADAMNKTFLHCAINNIPGYGVPKGQIAFEYVGSGPPNGSGKHRYVFLVYEQPNAKRIEVQQKIDSKTLAGRFPFDLRKYANEHGFGRPKAGNFYLAEYDQYSDVIQAQFQSQLTSINLEIPR